MTVAQPTVLVERDGAVATVFLNRPHRHNAWTGRMHREYKQAMAALETDEGVRAVVVTGTPPAFCVGGDSEALAGHADRGGYDPGESVDVPNPGAPSHAQFDHDLVWHLRLTKPVAAAYGARLPIGTPTGNMVVDMGGGTTEAAVASMYDIVVWSSVRIGGNRFDEAIVNYVRKKYNLLIGEQSAEEIKIAIGSALPLEDDRLTEVRGRDQVTGLPKIIQISSGEVTEALQEPLRAVVSTVRATLEKTPPELAADIIDRGMVLTGGSSQLRNIAQLLTQETGVPAYVAENPIACVALGAGRALENYEIMRRSLPIVPD